VITQPGERHPGLRAAVPAAGKIPDHLEPGQMRLIPPPRPRPRAPLLPAPVSAIPFPAAARAVLTGSRLRPRPLRGPPEHHPLQNRQVSPEIHQLGRLPGVLLPQPGVLLPEPGVLLAQLSGQPRHLPVRFQRRSQHIPQRCLSTPQDQDNPRRDRHPAQQTPSTTANHAPRTACPDPAESPPPNYSTHATSEYLHPAEQEVNDADLEHIRQSGRFFGKGEQVAMLRKLRFEVCGIRGCKWPVNVAGNTEDPAQIIDVGLALRAKPLLKVEGGHGPILASSCRLPAFLSRRVTLCGAGSGWCGT
jgi:hypothetical protein